MLLVMEEDYSEENRVAGQMKLKIHEKINTNKHRRGGVEEKNGEIENGGEEDRALYFKTLMLQLVTMTL